MTEPKFFFTVFARSKNEPFVREWVNHYTEEGADRIVIIDDASEDKAVYQGLPKHVSVLYPPGGLGPSKTQSEEIDRSYQDLRQQTKWLLFCDIDEYVTSRLRPDKTIRWELSNTFHDVHCVKVPWIMMASDGRAEQPKSVRKELITRWNHDIAHPHPNTKFRCRLDSIEVKCIFQPKFFTFFNDHRPMRPLVKPLKVVDSVTGDTANLDPYFHGLRELGITNSILICHHYRLTSVAAAKQKISTNSFYKNIPLSEFLASDHSEIVDKTLQEKAERRETLGKTGLESATNSSAARLGTWARDRHSSSRNTLRATLQSLIARGLTISVSNLSSAIRTSQWLSTCGCGAALSIHIFKRHIETRRLLNESASRQRSTPIRKAFIERMRQGTFDTDWFTTKIPLWVMIFHSEGLYLRPRLNCLEIGSWQGLSALFLLMELPNARLTCIDTWETKGSPENGHRRDLALSSRRTFQENLAEQKIRVDEFQGTSDEYFASQISRSRFDFVYIDGSHKSQDVLKDAVNSFLSLEQHGILVFDDLSWRQGSDYFDNPAPGIVAFLNFYRDSLEIIACTNQQLVVKKRGSHNPASLDKGSAT